MVAGIEVITTPPIPLLTLFDRPVDQKYKEISDEINFLPYEPLDDDPGPAELKAKR
jgi:hypothetical protein